MLSEEVNSLLRSKINQLIEEGWQRTKIAKLLMGEPAQVFRFLTTDENNMARDFGIKPLQRIADLLDCDFHLVVLERNPEDPNKKQQTEALLNQMEQVNIDFINELFEKLQIRLQESIQNASRTRQSNSAIDRIIAESLSEEIE